MAGRIIEASIPHSTLLISLSICIDLVMVQRTNRPSHIKREMESCYVLFLFVKLVGWLVGSMVFVFISSIFYFFTLFIFRIVLKILPFQKEIRGEARRDTRVDVFNFFYFFRIFQSKSVTFTYNIGRMIYSHE